MKFGIFYEHQLPRPWAEGAELRRFQEALDQVELANSMALGRQVVQRTGTGCEIAVSLVDPAKRATIR